ncbi:hypothetical protein MY04_4084 [Flammeovirga sp. MY04]|uniref:DUF6978 family protein n=1 Tax=Flammeovirga sp. MY04 TaxID=1191459 RepID=UPI00080630F9|nr:hypothetical protein [Flammeovirga sp. MY04]ANQ51428.1 hypothetical protein MY04_4084 [Flammeovirga sp. MY04]
MTRLEVDQIIKVIKTFSEKSDNVIDLTTGGKSIKIEKLLTLNSHWSDIKWSISKSKKHIGKVSLNCRIINDNINILRLDTDPLNRHYNPKYIEGETPRFLEKYSELMIEDQAHLHIFVENCELNWAIPLKDVEIFSTLEIKDIHDVALIIQNFADYINLESEISIIKPLL